MSSTLVRLAIEDETLIWAGLAAWLAGAGPGVEDREDKLLVKQLSNAICATHHPHYGTQHQSRTRQNQSPK